MKNLRKPVDSIVFIVLIAFLLSAGANAKDILPNTEEIITGVVANTVSGDCGASATWTLYDGRGELSITGNGFITEYNSKWPYPWYSRCNLVQSLTIGPGVTNVPSFAFAEDYYYMHSANLSATITTIGEYAFFESGLYSIEIPKNVTYIGTNAFAGCRRLSRITFTGPMPQIGEGAFDGVNATIVYPAGYAGYDEEDSSFNTGTLVLKPDCTMYGTHTPAEAVRENEVGATHSVEGHYDEVVYCSVCGDEISRQTNTIPIIENHISGDPVMEDVVNPTCTERGSYYEVIYCTICNTVISRERKTTPEMGHCPADSVIENEEHATCTVKGSYDEVVYCSVCETELSRNHMTIEALGHDPGEAVRENVIPATETSDGSYDEVVYCTRCELELSRENFIIPMLLSPPEITAQPISTTAIEGAEAMFHASANGQELTYQWYSMAPNAVKWTAVTPGGDQPDLIVPATMALNNTRYYCKVSNPAGVAETEAVTLSVSKASAPIVTAQPASVKVVVNKTATFTVSAQGTGLTYQWYVQTKGSTAWTPVGGATSAKLTVTATAVLDGAKYRCVVTGEGSKTATSNEVTLTVVTVPKITTQPKKASV